MPWALLVGAALLNAVATGLALWLAARRGGARLALAVAAVLDVVLHLYGPEVLTAPWNPYLPVLWWFVLLLAVWSVLDGDLPALPVAVLAGSLCMQTHIPYLLLGACVLALAGGAALRGARRAVPDGRRAAWRWTAIALAVGVVVWLPPAIDQLTNEPGNASKLLDHFGSPPEDETVLGAQEGLALLVRHLDPIRLLRGQALGNEPGTSLLPGMALLVAWAASVVIAWRLRLRSLLRLDLVLGVALVVGAVALGRILGFVWFYLSLWAFGLSALLLLAVGWTLVAAVTRGDRRGSTTTARAGAAVLAGSVLVWTTLTAVEAVDVERPDPADSDIMRDLLPATLAAMGDGAVDARGRDERWLVSWEIDPSGLGAQGFGLLLELGRQGFEVGGTRLHVAGSTPPRTWELDEATAFVHLAIGDDDVAVWRGRPGIEEVVTVDPREAEDKAEYDRLRAEISRDLDAVGLQDLVATFERIPFVAALDPRVPADLVRRIDRMVDLGLPTAVFLGPASAARTSGLGIQPAA
ncbi:hypothetical protein BH18ACT1_BH18ACT1_13270 [soil metagenome]